MFITCSDSCNRNTINYDSYNQSILVNPPDFGMEVHGVVVGSPWNIIISYDVLNMRWHSSKAETFQKLKVCIQLNKNSNDDNLNSVLCFSAFWHFRTTTSPVFQLGPTTSLRFQTRLTPLQSVTSKKSQSVILFTGVYSMSLWTCCLSTRISVVLGLGAFLSGSLEGAQYKSS